MYCYYRLGLVFPPLIDLGGGKLLAPEKSGLIQNNLPFFIVSIWSFILFNELIRSLHGISARCGSTPYSYLITFI